MPEPFGRYQLLRKLAVGGMAEIWLARQQGLEGFQKLLVLKRILPHLSENDEFVKMFLDEARIAARLNHANVVQIFDLGSQGEHYFIAMEYLHGEDARRLWRQAERQGKPLPPALACRIVMDACAGLDYAHKKSDDSGQPLHIVHRDVSPQNIIVTFEGGTKVVDFGIAKAADQSSVTRSGVVKGKYSYMSPEQAAGKKVDHKTDQFALGIVLYELVTGERLFKRASDIETLRAVEKCQIMPPSELNSRTPSSLDPVILKALSKDPNQRYPDCLAFQLAMEEWLLQNRLPSSSAQLAAFMSEIYAERLDEERRVGHPLWDDDASASNNPPPPNTNPGPPPPSSEERRSASGMTANAKPNKSISRAGSRAARPPSGGGELQRAAEVSKPPPPVATSPSLKRASAPPEVNLGQNLAVDDGATVSEHATVSSTGGSGSVSREVARGQARRSLWLGIGAGGVVVLVGMVGLALVTAKPQRVTTPENPSRAQGTQPETAARTARIAVTTDPPGATVTIDGQERGKSPLAPSAYGVGSTLKISAHLDGYEPASTTVSVSSDDSVVLRLTRTAAPQPLTNPPTTTGSSPVAAPGRTTLVLESPFPLTAKLDGRAVEIPKRMSVPVGRHTLVVMEESLDYRASFDLSARPGDTLQPAISPKVGKVMVLVSNGGGGDVAVGGVDHGGAPMPAFKLAVGKHLVRVTNHDTGQSQELPVEIHADQVSKLTFNLDGE